MAIREHLYRDSLGTCYGLTDNEGGRPIDVDGDTSARWRRVMAEFEAVQDEMETAYAKAVIRDREAEAVKKAEADIAEAQARLELVRWEQKHPPHDESTWPELDADSGGSFFCWFPHYSTENEAWQGRVHQYDRKDQLGVAMTFDLVPYTCPRGHWHLGRVAP